MNKKIIRVFPCRLPLLPTDDLVYINMPPPACAMPEHDEVHVYCIFERDKPRAETLKREWEAATDKPVIIGGPAYRTLCDNFTPGLYTWRRGVIMTSVGGGNNDCPWNMIHGFEGPIKELPVIDGHVIVDNNFLACSRAHKNNVFEMLKKQTGISFYGGLRCDLLDDHFIEAARSLKIGSLWLACDSDESLPAFGEAASKLIRAGFTRHQINAWALVGENTETDERRLIEIYRHGAMPYAVLRAGNDRAAEYSREWQKFTRRWSVQPGLREYIRARMRKAVQRPDPITNWLLS